MVHLRRFLVILMKKTADFFHGQQLTVPAVFIIVSLGWQYFTGQLSLHALQKNVWGALFPWIATAGVFGLVLVALTARDLNRELAAKSVIDKPRIILIGGEIPVGPSSKLPGRDIGLAFMAFILVLEMLAFRAAHPSIPPPTPPSTPPRALGSPPEHLSIPKPIYPRTLVDDPRIQFTSSPLWTCTRKNTVSFQVHEFDQYIIQYGIVKSPEILPLFSITEGIQTGFAFVGPPSPPFDQRKIPVATKRMTPLAIRASYGNYVFDTLLGVYAIPSQFGLVRESWIYAEYFARSSLNEAPHADFKSLDGWVPALWQIRISRGRDLTDRALLFGIKAPLDYSNDLTKHFRERLQLGVLAVKDTPEMIEINKILQRHGLLH